MTKRKFKRYNGEYLPDSAIAFLNNKHEHASSPLEYPGGWTDAYYEGDNAETATNWFITFDNGEFFKVNAEFITIFKRPGIEHCVGICNWSIAALNRTIKALRHGEEPPNDPWYET